MDIKVNETDEKYHIELSLDENELDDLLHDLKHHRYEGDWFYRFSYETMLDEMEKNQLKCPKCKKGILWFIIFTGNRGCGIL